MSTKTETTWSRKVAEKHIPSSGGGSVASSIRGSGDGGHARIQATSPRRRNSVKPHAVRWSAEELNACSRKSS